MMPALSRGRIHFGMCYRHLTVSQSMYVVLFVFIYII